MTCVKTVAALAATTALVVGGFIAAAPASAITAGQLTGSAVFLGDSYASGNAAGAYDTASGDCHRSANAYPVVWKAAYPGVRGQSFACSGATTANVLSAAAPEATVAAALGSATQVTITVGGNDIGFPQAVTQCLLGSDAECDDYLRTTTTTLVAALPAKLDALYARINALAPNASVEVVGYPRLFDASATSCSLWSVAKRQAMNAMSDRLSDAVAARAAAAGFVYRDVRGDFTGHGICSSAPWIVDAGTGATWEWLHPNAAGHARIAALLAAPQHPVEVSASGGRLKVAMTRELHASANRVIIWVNGAYAGETYRGSTYYGSVSARRNTVEVVPSATVKAGDRVQVGIVPGVPGNSYPSPGSVSLLADTQVDSVYSATLTGDGHLAVVLSNALFSSANQTTFYVNGTYHGATNRGTAYYLSGWYGGDGVHLTTSDGGFKHGDRVTVTVGSQTVMDRVL
ncbi:SGNH/GDSL hydrolase family protein [Leifsonia poae]|uniref:SGNH/GDSL hydrolase family protein n=1 Tax=Leifsonia poae TaxID=110933 RepID=UPI003D692A6A